MLKNQQYNVLKLTSKRLKKSNFNITLPLNTARMNREVVTINDSQLLRTLFNYKGVNHGVGKINNLLKQIKKYKKLKNTEEYRIKLEKTIDELDAILFVEDLILVEFDNKSHYREIVKRNGFYVNHIRFTPFMASAGMIRKNTALFINNNIKYPLLDILDNGRDESTPMVSAKFGAYFSLYASSTLPVSFPKFAVVPDKEISTKREVDFVAYVGEGEDDIVAKSKRVLKLNAWDGQGLISPALAERWSRELEMDYTFSAAIIRAPFLKGLAVVFDFHDFAKETGAKTFTDIYGNIQNIGDIDLLISESMFKLWSSYKSTSEYVEKCLDNELSFSVAKVNPKKERSYSRTSYQFLQVLKLNEVEIAKLCEPSVSWFRDISGDSAESMLLYATGEHEFDPLDFERMDVTTKALLLNPELSRDRYVQQRYLKSIQKKKSESYKGSLLINANYQFMIADPYYQACHVLGLDKTPLLKDGQHYSEYWLNKNITEVVGIRSPIVHHSEVNVLNFQNNHLTRRWFSHIHSGIVYPANGIGMDCAIHGGSDWDGDIVCTINNPIMMKGRIPSLPIVYESTKAEKVIVDSRDDKAQVESQLLGYNSKVGFATNISSSLYSMLEEYPVGSREHQAISNRLKIGRVIQGEIIDSVKGLHVPPFREHWTKYRKIRDDMLPGQKAKQEFYNTIVCEKRPAFFRFLYPHYLTRYNKELKAYNSYSIISFGKPFSDILKIPTSEAEKTIAERYLRRSFFLDNGSVVNRISRYMNTMLALTGRYSSKESRELDYHMLMNSDYSTNTHGLVKMKRILHSYKSFKRGLWHDTENSYDNMDAFIAYLRRECYSDISSNESELVNYAVKVTYGDQVSAADFVWKMFPEGLIQNIRRNSKGSIKMPVQDDSGDIEYLWNSYSLTEFSIEELYV